MFLRSSAFRLVVVAVAALLVTLTLSRLLLYGFSPMGSQSDLFALIAADAIVLPLAFSALVFAVFSHLRRPPAKGLRAPQLFFVTVVGVVAGGSAAYFTFPPRDSVSLLVVSLVAFAVAAAVSVLAALSVLGASGLSTPAAARVRSSKMVLWFQLAFFLSIAAMSILKTADRLNGFSIIFMLVVLAYLGFTGFGYITGKPVVTAPERTPLLVALLGVIMPITVILSATAVMLTGGPDNYALFAGFVGAYAWVALFFLVLPLLNRYMGHKLPPGFGGSKTVGEA